MQGTTLRNEVVFPYQLAPRKRLVFEGKGYLSTVTVDTDTIEVGSPQIEILYYYALQELARRGKHLPSDQDSAYWDRLMDTDGRTLREYMKYGMKLPARINGGPTWGR